MCTTQKWSLLPMCQKACFDILVILVGSVTWSCHPLFGGEKHKNRRCRNGACGFAKVNLAWKEL